MLKYKMGAWVDITGQTFGLLTAIKYEGHSNWSFECACVDKNIVVVNAYNVKSGHTSSCGCFRKETASKRCVTHGSSKTPEYNTYITILSKCYNPKNKKYKDYGGRGIKMCDRWLEDPQNFLDDMGKRPSDKTSINRINNDGNYEPGNCEWANNTEQANNRRSNRLIMFNGKTQNLTQWSNELGISFNVLRNRLRKNWSVEEAFTIPVTPYAKNLREKFKKESNVF